MWMPVVHKKCLLIDRRRNSEWLKSDDGDGFESATEKGMELIISGAFYD